MKHVVASSQQEPPKLSNTVVFCCKPKVASRYRVGNSCIYWAACGASPVLISVFGRLRRKTYSRGGEDTRSGAKKRFSHDCFHTIFPCMDIFCTTPSPPRNPEGVANHIVRSDLIISRTIERSHFVSFVTVRI